MVIRNLALAVAVAAGMASCFVVGLDIGSRHATVTPTAAVASPTPQCYAYAWDQAAGTKKLVPGVIANVNGQLGCVVKR